MGLWKWMMAFYLSHQTMLHDRFFPLVFLRGMKYSILKYSIPSVGSLTGLFTKKWIAMTDQYHWSALIYDMVIAQLLFRKTLHWFLKTNKRTNKQTWEIPSEGLPDLTSQHQFFTTHTTICMQSTRIPLSQQQVFTHMELSPKSVHFQGSVYGS